MDAYRDQQMGITTSGDLLLNDILRSRREFRSEIIRNDIAVIGISLLLIPIWCYMGLKNSSPWAWYLTIPVLIWYVVFILAYRMRYRQKPWEQGKPLHDCVRSSLNQIEDQIWLQRNIIWWYILPFYISLVAFFVHLEWLKQSPSNVLDSFGLVIAKMSIAGFVCLFVYYAVQYGVRSKLEPRRHELLRLLRQLDEKTSHEGS